jgi:hypothetical protein
VPLPISLVLKNGSKMRPWISGGIPTPSSRPREADPAIRFLGRGAGGWCRRGAWRRRRCSAGSAAPARAGRVGNTRLAASARPSRMTRTLCMRHWYSPMPTTRSMRSRSSTRRRLPPSCWRENSSTPSTILRQRSPLAAIFSTFSRILGSRLALEQQLAVADHAAQRVVDLVGDAGGEQADRGELLGLEDLVLEGPAVAQVEADEHGADDEAGVVGAAGPAAIRGWSRRRRPSRWRGIASPCVVEHAHLADELAGAAQGVPQLGPDRGGLQGWRRRRRSGGRGPARR